MLRERIINRIVSLVALAVFTGWLVPAAVLAVQEHGVPEGIYSHQGAHFLVRFDGAPDLTGCVNGSWCVRPAGAGSSTRRCFLILWSLDAFTAHLLDEQLHLVDIQPAGRWMVRIDAGDFSPALARLYYAAKLDHLLCVPAMLFLYFGLRRLLTEAGQRSREAGPP